MEAHSKRICKLGITVAEVVVASLDKAALMTVKAVLEGERGATSVTVRRKGVGLPAAADCQVITKLGRRHVVAFLTERLDSQPAGSMSLDDARERVRRSVLGR